jgi:Ca-activated chloride channel family protein
MTSHRVHISLEDQAAVTHVEQTFRNHTNRFLEAEYIFAVPRGASVTRFTMWVNGKETSGELMEAARARHIYEEIVRRTLDPGLLECMGNNCLRLRVFPIAPNSEQKVALSFVSIANRDRGVVEYLYPLRSQGQTKGTEGHLSIEATIKSQHTLQNIYSPTHAISVTRTGDHEARVSFDARNAPLNKDFQLFYGVGDKGVGITVLMHRPLSTEKGYFLMLLSPPSESARQKPAPRDMVFVLDTSGSMQGAKIDQAKRALKLCLDHLNANDRFSLMHFATTVDKYRDGLIENNPEQIEQAKAWVNALEATGGTAIDDALAAALSLRGHDSGRTFTIVFFTDGEPTVGVTDPEQILKNVAAKNSENTRIFPFGVGDDVNASLLDRLAEQSRAVTTYVRPAEDIEAKVSSLVAKISHPVLTGLGLAVSRDIRLEEVYPSQLLDLFQGDQLTVIGRYSGSGNASITLSGSIGGESRKFTHELSFADKTNNDRNFVEHLWARRKVGYLLDQVRANGEKKELVDELVSLAKKYGIATPYTSYLVVPDGMVPLVRRDPRKALSPYAGAGVHRWGGAVGGQSPAPMMGRPIDSGKVADYVSRLQGGSLTETRASLVPEDAIMSGGATKSVYDQARMAISRGRLNAVQSGKLGVDLSIETERLRRQSQMTRSSVQQVAGRKLLEVNGVWIDEGFDAKMPKVIVRAMSAAYFRLLTMQPRLKEVFQLGNYLVWVTPNQTALIVDTNDGVDTLADERIEAMFKQ